MTTEEKRTINLKEANRIRRLRKELKAEIRHAGSDQGRYILAEAIESLPDWLEAQDAWDALEWSPRCGEASAAGMMHLAGVTRKAPLSALTQRQRTVLADCLRTGSQRFAEKAAA